MSASTKAASAQCAPDASGGLFDQLGLIAALGHALRCRGPEQNAGDERAADEQAGEDVQRRLEAVVEGHRCRRAGVGPGVVRDPDDRRRHVVKLTPGGREALTELRAISKTLEKGFLAPLSADERRTLHSLLQRVASYHDPRLSPKP